MNGILAIGPHADDVELGCGGTLAKSGQQITIGIVSLSTYRSRLGPVDSSNRRLEALAAGQVLKAQVKVGPFKENQLPNESMAAIIGWIEELIEEVKPRMLYIPPASFNQDHRVVWEACLAALRPNRVYAGLETVLAYEMALNAWAATGMDTTFGHVYSELDQNALSKKLQAFRCHRSQWEGREDGLISATAIHRLAALRGLEMGAGFAERFQLLRTTGLV